MLLDLHAHWSTQGTLYRTVPEEKPEAGLRVEGLSARGAEWLVRRGKEEAETRRLGNPGQVSEVTCKLNVNNNKNKRPLKYLCVTASAFSTTLRERLLPGSQQTLAGLPQPRASPILSPATH